MTKSNKRLFIEKYWDGTGASPEIINWAEQELLEAIEKDNPEQFSREEWIKGLTKLIEEKSYFLDSAEDHATLAFQYASHKSQLQSQPEIVEALRDCLIALNYILQAGYLDGKTSTHAIASDAYDNGLKIESALSVHSEK